MTNSHGFVGFVPSATSVPSITPSPSVSGFNPSVPIVASCWFVKPSSSQSCNKSVNAHGLTVIKIVSVVQIAGRGVPLSQIVTTIVSVP